MASISKPIRKGIPTFRVFTDYVANQPHCVTVRPVAIPENPASELFVASEISGVLKREVQRVVSLLRPHWAPTTINSRVSIVLNATNLTGGGVQTLDRFTSLRDLKPDDILRIIAKSEYADVTVYDLEWRLTIVPASIMVGSGSSNGPPSYCNPKKFKTTWLNQFYKGQDISCAAFAINYRMQFVEKNYSSNQTRASKDAFELQEKLGWSKETTIDQLEQFVVAYPTWRLVVLQVAFPSTDYVYDGKEFIFDDNDPGKKVVYLVYDSKLEHYGLTVAPKELYAKYLGRNDILFCPTCTVMYTKQQNHECDLNPYFKPERLPPCATCGRYGKHSCSETTCKYCKVVYGRGSKENYEIHNCILYREPCKKILVQTQDDLNRKAYGLFTYDIECQIETVETTKSYISEFALEDGMFTNNQKSNSCEGEPIKTFIQTSNSLDRHVANLVCLQNVFTNEMEIFKGENCIKEMLEYLRKYNLGRNIVIAHNAAGYDTRLVFETAARSGIKDRKMVPILQGSKFVQLTIGKLIFRDSMLHLKGSLAALAKDFCSKPGSTKMEKGFFPHLFNTAKHWDYEGPIPGKEYFDLPFSIKDQKALDEFNIWYASQQGIVWNFQKEILKYCVNDVRILSEIVRGYHDNAMALVGASPWFNATAPSFVHETILIDLIQRQGLQIPRKKKEMDAYKAKVEKAATETGWAVLVSNEVHHARLGLRGGRTDCRKLYHTVTEEEHAEGRDIIHQDIVSQYPFQQVNHDFPTGKPLCHIFDIRYYPCVNHQNSEEMRQHATCECTDKRGDKACNVVDMVGTPSWTYDEIKAKCWTEEESKAAVKARPNFFGIITVTLTAPKDLYHPVLVVKDKIRNKSIATLEDESLKEITIATIELLEALENGYTLQRIHRYDQYTQSPSLWKEMILKFFVEKLINSQDILTEKEFQKFYNSDSVLTTKELEKKKEALTPKQASELVQYYDKQYGIGHLIQKAIDEGRFADNPALKATAKTMLNSAWGKHAQRLIMTEGFVLNHYTQRQEVDNLFQNIADKVYSHKDTTILNDAEVFYRANPKNAKPDLHNMYLPAAVFVTAYARRQLWRELNKLGERVLYFDTDSIIYVRDPDGYNIPEGNKLGQWEIEKPCKLNSGLKMFVCFGPKTYAFTAWRQDYKIHTVVKAKGISLKQAHSNLVNFQVMESKVLDFLNDSEDYLFRKVSPIKVPQKNFRFSLDHKVGMRTIKSLKDLKINPKELKGVLHGAYLYPFGHERNKEGRKRLKLD